MTRQTHAVGNVITGAELTAASQRAVQVFASRAAAEAAAAPPLGTLAYFTAEGTLAAYWQRSDGTPAWLPMNAPAASQLPAPPQARFRVPEVPITWHTASGALTADAHAQAFAAGHLPPADRQVFQHANVVEFPAGLAYVIEADTELEARGTCEVAVLLVGGGGSGSGMWLVQQQTATFFGVQWPHSPHGGGGGGSGAAVVAHFQLRRNDRLQVSVGAGGTALSQPQTSVAGVPSGSRQAGFENVLVGGAGGATSVRLNGVLVAYAGGGSGGRIAPLRSLSARSEALAYQAMMNADGTLHRSYGLGNGGGGGLVTEIIGNTSRLAERAGTPEPPVAWQPLSADAPPGSFRRGGLGGVVPHTLAQLLPTTGYQARAGAGGGGIDSNGLPIHGADGEVLEGGGHYSGGATFTGGWLETLTQFEVGNGGGGGTAELIEIAARPTDDTWQARLRGATRGGYGAGSGGGGMWHLRYPNVSGFPDPGLTQSQVAGFTDVLPARSGVCVIMQPRPGTPLQRITTRHTYSPKVLTNTPPQPPEITAEPYAPSQRIDTDLTLTITPTELDALQPQLGWQLRRTTDGGSNWQYLRQGTSASASQDVWDDTLDGAVHTRTATAGSVLGLSYTLRPGWAATGQEVRYSARTRDADGVWSAWAYGLTKTALPPNTPPSQPVLSRTPNTASVPAHTPVQLVWAYTDTDGDAQVGVRITRTITLSSGTLSPQMLTITAGAQSWITTTDDAPTDAPQNYLPLTDNNITIDAVGASVPIGATVSHTVAVIAEAGAGALHISDYSAAVSYEVGGGSVSLLGAPSGAQPTFDFGGGERNYVFQVQPSQADVTVSVQPPGLFTATLTGTTGQRQLTLAPPATDTAEIYAATATLTATAHGYTPATSTLTLTLTAPPPPLQSVQFAPATQGITIGHDASNGALVLDTIGTNLAQMLVNTNDAAIATGTASINTASFDSVVFVGQTVWRHIVTVLPGLPGTTTLSAIAIPPDGSGFAAATYTFTVTVEAPPQTPVGLALLSGNVGTPPAGSNVMAGQPFPTSGAVLGGATGQFWTLGFQTTPNTPSAMLTLQTDVAGYDNAGPFLNWTPLNSSQGQWYLFTDISFTYPTQSQTGRTRWRLRLNADGHATTDYFFDIVVPHA